MNLIDLVDLCTNNKDMVVLKVKDHCSDALKHIGFIGNEKYISLTKGSQPEITIQYKDNHSEHWMVKEALFKKNPTQKAKQTVAICLCVKFGFNIYSGEDDDLILESLKIKNREDAYSLKREVVSFDYVLGAKDEKVFIVNGNRVLGMAKGLKYAKELYYEQGLLLDPQIKITLFNGITRENFLVKTLNKNLEE